MPGESPNNNMGAPPPPSGNVSADFDRWRVEQEVRLKRDELELKRKELAKHLWSSPLVLAVIGLIATILGNTVQNYFQNSSAKELEQRRFEAELVRKAIDTTDQGEAAARLKLYFDLGLIKDDKGKIAGYVQTPGEIPLQSTGASLVDCTEVKTIADCPDEGCGGSYDANLNKRKNIRSDNQTATMQSINWMKNLPDPTNFTRNAERQELAQLGEGKKITVVAYALVIRKGARESCNCGLTAPEDTDNTIVLVDPTLSRPTLAADEQNSITAEFTPRVRLDHPNFTKEKLQPLIEIHGRLMVRVTGLLLFDSEHMLSRRLKRHNNWEIHPILKLEYCPEGKICREQSNENWKDLDNG
jgi:hypothetical protein